MDCLEKRQDPPDGIVAQKRAKSPLLCDKGLCIEEWAAPGSSKALLAGYFQTSLKSS